MKVLIKGYYGFGNLGDDLLLVSVFSFVKSRYPSAIIDVFSNNTKNNPSSNYPKGYNKYLEKLIPSINKLIDWTNIEFYDVIIDGGGGIYFDYGKASKVGRIQNGIASRLNVANLLRLESFLRAVTGKKPNLKTLKKIGIGISIGPYEVVNKNYLSLHLNVNAYHGLLVRDEISLSYVKNPAVISRSSVDLAFLSDRLEPKEALQGQKERNRVGIIILNWYVESFQNVSSIVKASRQLQGLGFEVTFFSFDQYDDQPVLELLGDASVEIWDPLHTSLEDYIEKISQMDVLASMRYHGCVIATCLGIPTLILAVSQKLKQLALQISSSSIEVMPPFKDSEVVQSLMTILGDYENYVAAALSNRSRLSQTIKQDLNCFLEEVLPDGIN